MIVRRLILLGLLGGVVFWTAPVSGQARFLNKTASDWMNELGAGEAKVRRNAAFALGKMGRDADIALRRLQQCVKGDSDAGVREAAAFALGEIGQVSLKTGGSAELVALLSGALKDKDALVRRSAAYALGCLREDALPALPALETAVGDSHPGVRQNAAWALGRLGAKETVAPLRKALVDADPVVRRDA